MDSILHKTCIHCGQSQPLANFNKDRNRKDGYRETCKACRSAYRRETRNDRDRAHRRAYDQNRYQNDPIFHEKEQARQREKNKRQYRENPVRHEAQRNHGRAQHSKRKNNPALYERWQQSCRTTEQRRKMRRAADIAYDAHIRSRAVRTAHAYRARKAANGGSYTAQEWNELCAFYDHACLCCGECKPLTPDHVVPISRGGSNAIENIQPLCLDCNRRKSTKTIDYRPTLPPWMKVDD